MEMPVPGTMASNCANPQPRTYAAMKSPRCKNCGRCDQTRIIGCSYRTNTVRDERSVRRSSSISGPANSHHDFNPVMLRPHLMEIHALHEIMLRRVGGLTTLPCRMSMAGASRSAGRP